MKQENATLSKEEKNEKKEKKERTLADLSVTNWLTPKNASFFVKNGFLYVKLGEKEERAFLYRQFPFEVEWEFISVMDGDKQEIGILRELEQFDADTKALLIKELTRRYYTPVIEKIYSMKERYGFSYWKVQTKDGEVSFTLQDTFRSMIHTGENRLLLLDVCGNRFEIPDVTALDRKSYKKIELYL